MSLDPGKDAKYISDLKDVSKAAPADNNVLTWDSATQLWTPESVQTLKTAVIPILIDGGGSTITSGIKGWVAIPFACTINQLTMLADQIGSIVIDIWKDTYGNYPPTDADSITALAVPTISSAIKSQDSVLTGWNTSILDGDILYFNVDSATTIQKVLVSLKVTKI